MRWLGLAVALIIIAIVAILGFARWKATRIDQPAFVAVTATWPGASADSMEREVTEQLERALSQVPNVRHLRSESRESVALVFVEVLHAPIEDELFVVQRAQQAVAGVQNTLPHDVSPPTLQRVAAPDQRATHRWLIESSSMSSIELTKWAKDVFRRKLQVQNGVRAVEFCGARDAELSIELDLNRLQATGLSASQVVQALQSAASDLPGGRVQQGERELTIRAFGRLKLEELHALSLGQVKLQDVAVLHLDAEQERGCVAHAGGRAVLLAEVQTFATLDKPLELPTNVPSGVSMTPFASKRAFSFDALAAEDRLASKLSALSGAVKMKGTELEWLTDEESPRAAAEIPGLALRDAPGGVTVTWRGADRSVLRQVAEKGRAKLAAANPAWVGTVWPSTTATRQLQVDRERAARLGTAPAELFALIRLITTGVRTGELDSGERVVVRTTGAFEEQLQSVRTRAGIALSELVSLELKEVDANLFRLDRERALQVRVGLDAEAARKLLEPDLPPGVRVSVE